MTLQILENLSFCRPLPSFHLDKYNGAVGIGVAFLSCALLGAGITIRAAISSVGDPLLTHASRGYTPGHMAPMGGGVMLYSLLSQVSQSIVYASLSPWMSNVVRDHKTLLSPDLFPWVQLIATTHSNGLWGY